MSTTLTAEQLRERLTYEPETGLFRWAGHSRNGVQTGRLAGGADSDGYIRITISQRMYAAHRLAWLYVYGEWPEHTIDHINGDRADNRIANLRDVTLTVNNGNRTSAHGTSPTQQGRYRAEICTNGVKRHLGCFASKELAAAAYKRAKAAADGDRT